MRSIFFYILACFFLIIIPSCKKNTDCYGTIICKDVSGNIVPNATVDFYKHVKSNVGSTNAIDSEHQGKTDDNGRVSFSFKRPSMYSIRVSKDNFSGSTIMQLVAGKETQKDIVIQ